MVSLTSVSLGSNSFRYPIPENLSFRKVGVSESFKKQVLWQCSKSSENFASLSYITIQLYPTKLYSNLEILQHCKNLSSLGLTHWNEKMHTDLKLQNIPALAKCRINLITNFLQNSTNLHLLHFMESVESW